MEFELHPDHFVMMLTILNRSHPLPPDLNVLFQKIELIKIERTATYLINYLCMVINKNKCVDLMPWPLTDKKSKSQFYVGLRKFLTESNKELSDFNLPTVLSSTLSLPSSLKYTSFLYKLLRCTFEIHVRNNLGFYDIPLSLENCGEKFTIIIARDAYQQLKNKSQEESKLERLKGLREKNKILDEKLALATKTKTCLESSPSSIIEESLKSVINSLDVLEEGKKASCLELDDFNASMKFLMNLDTPEDLQSLGVRDLESKIDELCKIYVSDTTQNCLKNNIFTSKLANLLSLLTQKTDWLMQNSFQMNQEIIEKTSEIENISLLFEDIEITMENGIETSINLTPQTKDISNCVKEYKKKLFEELFPLDIKPDIIAEVKHNLNQTMLFKSANRTTGTSASPLARSVLEKQTWNSQAVTPSGNKRHSHIKPLKASSPLSDSFSTTVASEESINCIFSDDDSLINESNTSDFLPINRDTDSINVHRDSIDVQRDSIDEHNDSFDSNVKTSRNTLKSVIIRYRELRRKMN